MKQKAMLLGLRNIIISFEIFQLHYIVFVYIIHIYYVCMINNQGNIILYFVDKMNNDKCYYYNFYWCYWYFICSVDCFIGEKTP